MEMGDSSQSPPMSATSPTDMVPEQEPEAMSSSSSVAGDATPPYSTSLSRSHSSASASSLSQDSEEWEIFPPMDKLTIFDLLDQLALPQRLEKINRTYMVQRENLRKQSDRVKRRFVQTKAKADFDLEKYRIKYNQGLDRIFDKWNDTRAVSTREKAAFVVGVSNIFVTGFLMGGYP
jgi:hypothetical protein